MDAARTKAARFDRHFWLMLLISAAVLLPRAAMISDAHNDYTDDQYHLVRGQRFLAGMLGHRPILMNDPPLGEGLIALPVRLSGIRALAGNIVYDQNVIPPERLLRRIALWKAFLFLPMIAVAFLWSRQLYGVLGGWLAGLLLLFEPTFIAHINPAALDVLGVEAIFISCYLAWRYVDRPTMSRALVVCFSIAVALLIKNTAIILPAVIGLMVMGWALKRRNVGWRHWKHLLLAVLITPLIGWALLGFDISRPTIPKGWAMELDRHPIVAKLDRRLPAGVYVSALISAAEHAERGHSSFLSGKTSAHGWWYYFPVVAMYKVPIGYALLAALAVASMWFVRPRWDELSLLLPALAWAIFLAASGINIGWRHFLPAYAFMLVLMSRVVASSSRPMALASFACLACGALHAITWHPNYLSYLNAPRRRAHLAISDSNLDWGQGVKQAREWIVAHPELTAGDKRVYVRIFCRDESPALNLYLSGLPNVRVLRMRDAPPRSGTLIVSSVWLSGLYGERKYLALQRQKPIDQIGGGAMRVYDLNRSGRWRNYVRSIPKPATMPTTP